MFPGRLSSDVFLKKDLHTTHLIRLPSVQTLRVTYVSITK